MFLVFNITFAFWKTKKNNNSDKRKEKEKIHIFLGKLVPSPSLISFFQNKKDIIILASTLIQYIICDVRVSLDVSVECPLPLHFCLPSV